VVLCLPATLAQMASVSHDGPAIGCAALAAALAASAIRSERRLHPRGFAACALALLLLAVDRPPLAPLALVLLAVPAMRLRVRLAGVAVVWSGCLGWMAFVSPMVPVGFPWVEGIQGRYFIPILLFLPCLLPPSNASAGARLRTPALLALGLLGAFPIASLVGSVEAVVARYYG